MRPEPAVKPAIAFIDGQNLFHSARAAFCYSYPNYDPARLARSVCDRQGWRCDGARFYTGIPSLADKPDWHRFWIAKGARMGHDGVHVVTRPLAYRHALVRLADGTAREISVGQEKGIDVRLALDVIRLAHQGALDVALLFCRDNDLAELAAEIRAISVDQARWIKIASAYPFGPAVRHHRGIAGTDWIRIERATYDSCLDPRDYRARRDA